MSVIGGGGGVQGYGYQPLSFFFFFFFEIFVVSYAVTDADYWQCPSDERSSEKGAKFETKLPNFSDIV